MWFGIGQMLLEKKYMIRILTFLIILHALYVSYPFPNLFYFMFQSEPEEMPPEAKMRMKNIGRLDLILYQSNVLF